MNLTSYRKQSGYGHRAKWSKRAVAAKARKRIERAENPPDEEIASAPFIPAKIKHATVSIRCGDESVSFQVFRLDEKRLVMRGKAQAASSIGKRITLLLDSQL